MKITSGLALIAAALTVTACGNAAGHDTASAPNALISSFLRAASPSVTANASPSVTANASPSVTATGCQAQVAAWTGSGIRTLAQYFKEEIKLTLSPAATSPVVTGVQLAPFAGPVATVANLANGDPPPKCSANLSRHWATFVSNLFGLAAQLRLADLNGIATDLTSTNSAVARLMIDLHMKSIPIESVSIPAHTVTIPAASHS